MMFIFPRLETQELVECQQTETSVSTYLQKDAKIQELLLAVRLMMPNLQSCYWLLLYSCNVNWTQLCLLDFQSREYTHHCLYLTKPPSLNSTFLNFNELKKITERSFSDWDKSFDTPLDYTKTIFMEVLHFLACGDTTRHTRGLESESMSESVESMVLPSFWSRSWSPKNYGDSDSTFFSCSWLSWACFKILLVPKNLWNGNVGP